MQQIPSYPQTGPSGILMKASAVEFDPNAVNKAIETNTGAQDTFLSGESGLVNEDAQLEIQAENRLLAQTSFEYMGLDPRFVKALYSYNQVFYLDMLKWVLIVHHSFKHKLFLISFLSNSYLYINYL